MDTSSLSGIEAISSQPTTSERILSTPTLLNSYTTPSDPEPDTPNITPLASPAALGVRREFSHAPLRSQNAFQAYSGLTADDFSGPQDLRLQQLQRSTQVNNNVLRNSLVDAFPEPTADVGGRAKTPVSTFGKLQEAADTRIGDIKDLSGLRVDVDPVRPGFADVYDAQSRVQNVLGDNLVVKQDYIQQPNRWDYTGRVHSLLTEPSGLTHEVQVGTRDISNFIETDLTNSNG